MSSWKVENMALLMMRSLYCWLDDVIHQAFSQIREEGSPLSFQQAFAVCVMCHASFWYWESQDKTQTLHCSGEACSLAREINGSGDDYISGNLGRGEAQGRDTQPRWGRGQRKLRRFMEGVTLELSLKGPIRIWQVREGDEWRESFPCGTQVYQGREYWQIVLLPGTQCACMPLAIRMTLGKFDHLWAERLKCINQGKHRTHFSFLLYSHGELVEILVENKGLMLESY